MRSSKYPRRNFVPLTPKNQLLLNEIPLIFFRKNKNIVYIGPY
jgi:hypothetical protein